MKATFVSLTWENPAHTIATFSFQPAGRYRYEAGQYAVLSVPHDHPDSRGTERTMTLSSAPHEPLLSFTMRVYGADDSAVSDGGHHSSSFKRALLALRPGDIITVYDALGDMVLPLDASIPLVFVAGGVGIASYTGMIKTLTMQHDQRRVLLHYSVSRPGDIVLQQPFDDYAAHYPLTRTYYGAGRRLTAADILAAAPGGAQIYLSGTETMVEDIRTALLDAAVQRSQIVFDYFDGYSEL